MEPESVADEVALAWPRLATGLAARGGAVDGDRGPALGRGGAARHARAARRALDRAAAARRHRAARAAGGASRLGRAAGGVAAHARAADRRRDAPPGRRAAARRAAPPCTSASWRTAEGNPFFAEEIAHHLRDRGVRAAGDEPLPTTVRAVLAARVDALPAGREARAAGRRGRRPLVLGLEPRGDGRRPGAAAALRTLEERGLVITRPTSSLPGQTELWFRHALIREVAYRSIPDAQRRAVHASVGEWIEAADRRPPRGVRRPAGAPLRARRRTARSRRPIRAKAVRGAGRGRPRRAPAGGDRRRGPVRRPRAGARAPAPGVPGRARAQGARAARRGARPTRASPPTRRRSTSRAARTPTACARTRRCCARATPGAFTRPGLARVGDRPDRRGPGRRRRAARHVRGRGAADRPRVDGPLVRAVGRRADEGAPRRRAGDRDRRADRLHPAALARARGARLARRRPRLLRRERHRRPACSSVVRRMPDRVEASESLVIAAVCLLRARALRGRLREPAATRSRRRAT